LTDSKLHKEGDVSGADSANSTGASKAGGFRSLKDFATTTIRLLDRGALRIYLSLLKKEIALVEAALATLNANEWALGVAPALETEKQTHGSSMESKQRALSFDATAGLLAGRASPYGGHSSAPGLPGRQQRFGQPTATSVRSAAGSASNSSYSPKAAGVFSGRPTIASPTVGALSNVSGAGGPAGAGKGTSRAISVNLSVPITGARPQPPVALSTPVNVARAPEPSSAATGEEVSTPAEMKESRERKQSSESASAHIPGVPQPPSASPERLDVLITSQTNMAL